MKPTPNKRNNNRNSQSSTQRLEAAADVFALTAASQALKLDSATASAGCLVGKEVVRPTQEKDAKQRRYDRRDTARKALYNPELEKQPGTCLCGLTPLPIITESVTLNGKTYPGQVFEPDYVHIVRDGSGDARIENMMMCNSVWACPVCAARITEKRRVQLDQVIAGAKAVGWGMALITMTLSHVSHMGLFASLNAVKEAQRRFKSGRWFQNVSKDFGWKGSIQATEVTYGKENGWHPHIHMLVFFEWPLSPALLAALESQLKAAWIDRLKKQGYGASWEHGLDIRTADSDIADYVAKFGREPQSGKWGAAHELAKLPVKTGRDDEHYTPFQLLDLFASGESWAGDRFAEYAATMKGRRQLVGLADMAAELGVDIEADEDVIDSEAATGAPALWASIYIASWRRVVVAMLSGKATYYEMLDHARRDDKEGFREWLDQFDAAVVFFDDA